MVHSSSRNPQAARAGILTAAAAEFAAHGYAGARVDRIAGAAGYNKRMLYHYFTDKRGLYAAVLGEVVPAGGVAPDAPVEVLARLLAHRLGSGDATAARLVLWELLQPQGGDGGPDPVMRWLEGSGRSDGPGAGKPRIRLRPAARPR